MANLLDPVIKFFCSLRLTVVLLVLAMLLVFLGTMAQEPLGLYIVQAKFFRSFFIEAAPMAAALKKSIQILGIYLPPSTAEQVLNGSRFPVFPGGYLVGGLLLINLVAAHYKRFEFSRRKIGIFLTHIGIILLLLGQLLTDALSVESTMHIREGGAKNYSETVPRCELAVVDVTDADSDRVVAIPQRLLMKPGEIRHAELPFTIRVKKFYLNSEVAERPAGVTAPLVASEGIGPRVSVRELPRVTSMDRRDFPSAVIELLTPQGSLGTWFVSEMLRRPQPLAVNGRQYELALREQRHYKPFTLALLDFTHEKYPGTEIPKDFSSRVRLRRADTGEDREVRIYMNNPLRYWGETYYQSGFDPDNGGTILQVVRNPSWLAPYFACGLVGVGLVVQFMTHLIGFAMKRGKPVTATR